MIYSGGEAYRDHPIDITILSGLNFDSLGSRFKLAVGEYELERSDVFNPIVPQYFQIPFRAVDSRGSQRPTTFGKSHKTERTGMSGTNNQRQFLNNPMYLKMMKFSRRLEMQSTGDASSVPVAVSFLGKSSVEQQTSYDRL